MEIRDVKVHVIQAPLKTPSYIAAGENIFGKIAYKEWLQKGALDIYQPDLCSSCKSR